MTPYYQDDAVTIYHGDALDLFPVWDLAGAFMVTDPPYGIDFASGKRAMYGHDAMPISGDSSTAARDAVLGLWSPRPAIVFGSPRRSRPDGTRHVLIWDKGLAPGMGDLSIPWGPSYEEICVVGAGFVGKRSASVLRYWQQFSGQGAYRSTLRGERHPTQKPADLMRDLVEKCAPLAEIVDPFMGSGTTLRAAKDLGRRTVGVEIEERYCEIAAKRMGQEVLPL